jgi:aryl-alcohol dehydrogenase-like predicted oxidoreductase
MSFGVPERGNHSWTLPEEESRKCIKQALDFGINFFDTANVYSDGTSEEIVGRALNDYCKREDVVIATKVNARMRAGPHGVGLSRKSIMFEVDQSLRRLKTDYIDLYQVHRWDASTPIEETLEALHDLVKKGKVHHIGASSMYAWQFAKALHASDKNGWSRFVSMQNYVNLLYREEEREMLPLCQDEGVGVIPWSPLARGRLTRDWDDTTERSQNDEFGKKLYALQVDADRKVVERLSELSRRIGAPRAQVALAWLLQKSSVVSPIVGATKLHHLDDAVNAVELKLSAEDIASLEEPYVPHVISGI